ncbi:MAG: hypothetical protein QOE58_3626 [Actinomycetota bacterium]|nr:hypothetical protein [Actinomycetota bacterium]
MNFQSKDRSSDLYLPRGIVTIVGVLIFSFLLMPEQPSLLNVANFTVHPRNSIMLIIVCMALLWRAEGHLPRIQLAAGRWWLVWLTAVILGCIVRGSLTPIPLFFLTYLLPYALGCTLGQRAAIRERAGKALGIATLVVAALALFEFVTSSYIFPVNSDDLASYSRIGISRARANFGHPLALGKFLTLG